MNKGAQVSRPRVLVVDDHQAVVQKVIALLRGVFDIVGTASCGRELISEGMRLKPEIIVADISMPDLSGIEAVEQLRAQRCNAKVIFLSIHCEEEFVNACLAAGGMGYVAKMHMKRDLIPAINAALSSSRFVSVMS